MSKRIRCDQCQLLRINGIVCHEIGCPNMPKVRRCKACGRPLKIGTFCNRACADRHNHGARSSTANSGERT